MSRSAKRTDKDEEFDRWYGDHRREDIPDLLGRWAWLLVVLGLGICTAGLFLAGCTVRPKVVRSSQASFDGNQQNSGLIGYDAVNNRIITSHARDRYNSLVDYYGKLFQPPINRDDGIIATSTNTYLLDSQHAFYFETFQRWRHQGKAPK